jgi:D-alanine-D-alanine ligase
MSDSTRKKIAVLAGGNSAEANVSISSAREVMKHIDREKFEPFLITISGSDWLHETERGGQTPIDKNDFSLTMNAQRILFDAVFVMIHGSPGEDGKIQGYFDMLGITYSTSSALTLALTMNKAMTKEYLRDTGPKLAKGMLLHRDQPVDETALVAALGLPLFVKPNSNGSSYGVTKVNEAPQLGTALQLAFAHDHEVLAEEFVSGTEVTCGLLMRKGELLVLPLTEVVSKKEFFDYEAKYLDGFSEEITPARIEEATAQQIRNFSAIIYRKLSCRGVVRIDYIVRNGVPYLLEVNTVPGFTSHSIVPQQAAKLGISFSELITLLIEEMLPATAGNTAQMAKSPQSA